MFIAESMENPILSLDDKKLDKLLHYILHGKVSITHSEPYNLQNIENHINNFIENNSEYSLPAQPKDTPGRLGGKNVVLDASTNVGIFIVEEDRLGVSSQANFSTVRANCCVFKGKWIYEVMLSTKGVMQIGWSTKNCHFSHEQGVGDTPDSYAYDGNRVRKWNVSTGKYGDAWRIGDTISCAIDMDNGIISFYRNGRYLGEAFNDIKMGYGIAYFPTISLSLHEGVRLNFGATPLLHPVDGYKPLQDSPLTDLVKTKIIFACLQRIVDIFVRYETVSEKMDIDADVEKSAIDNTSGLSEDYSLNDVPHLESMSQKALLFLLAGMFYDKLLKYLNNGYIVETCFFKLLRTYCDNEMFINRFLDIFWAFVGDNAMLIKNIMSSLVNSLLIHYRFSPLELDFQNQKTYLQLLTLLLKHEPTRKYVLQHILFDKTKLPLFMHLKSPDFTMLEKFMPRPYLNVDALYKLAAKNMTPAKNSTQINENIEKEKPKLDPQASTSKTNIDKNDVEKSSLSIFVEKTTVDTYSKTMKNLQNHVGEVEKLQQQIVKIIINNRDVGRTVSSRFIFLKKFREFIRQNLNLNIINHPFNKCPYPAILCFFHHLIKETRSEWERFNIKYPHRSVPIQGAFIPAQTFYNDSINYFDLQRLAGLFSYLKKTYESELNADLNNYNQHSNNIGNRKDNLSENNNTFSTSNKRINRGNDLTESSTSLSSTSVSSLNNQPSNNMVNQYTTNMDQSLRSEISSSNPNLAIRNDSQTSSNNNTTSTMYSNVNQSTTQLDKANATISLNPRIRAEASSSSLIELLDGIVLLYFISGHKHTSKMAKVREILKEYLTTITSLQQNINICPPDKTGIKNELERTKQVFINNAMEQARLLAWIKVVVFSKEKQSNVAWLLGVIIRTLNKAIDKGGNLYLFVPEFYLETCLNIFSDLKNNFNPTAPLEDIADFNEVLLPAYVILMVRFFSRDAIKIVNADLREKLTQSLGDCVCYAPALHVLEHKLGKDQRLDLVRTLLRPYENRPWAQTNWILVRFWKGCGFGFRYTMPPIPEPKAVHYLPSSKKSCPQTTSEITINDSALNINDDDPHKMGKSARQDSKSGSSPLIIDNNPSSSSRPIPSVLRSGFEAMQQSYPNLISSTSSLTPSSVDSVNEQPYSDSPSSYTNLIPITSSISITTSTTNQTALNRDGQQSLPQNEIATNIISNGNDNSLLPRSEPTQLNDDNNTINRLSPLTNLGNTASTSAINMPSTSGLLPTRSNAPGSKGPSMGEMLKPMPSPIYQAHVGEVLSEDVEKAAATVNSILNQLNWAFSEFVGMLQEIQQAATRTDVQVFIDARQLKLCATCYDLTVYLLRCLELISHVCPDVFTAFEKSPSAEIMLTNLFQLICQILARVTTKKSAFNMVIALKIAGLELIQHYIIISAVVGILVQLIMRVNSESQKRTLYTLLHEPGFQLSSLKSLLEMMETDQYGHQISAEDVAVMKLFCLRYYTDVNQEEINELWAMIELLETEEKIETSTVRKSISDEDLCPICYARPLEVKFIPCGHESCRSCITHYMMNKKECFFCKAIVESIKDIAAKS